jgi:glycolate oxidase FAD binding subunit
MAHSTTSQNVMSPESLDQAVEYMRHANEQRLAIEVVGAGTKRSWGNAVAAPLLMDTKRLAGIKEHSWQDLTATVAAGTPWNRMQEALAVHGQYVALDPLWSSKATVGGIVATNDSGSLRLRYGSLRDLIIGMTVVLADGTVAKSGGKVVKNVAGYDIHKLMTGAFGTLGLITEVTFRLHPLPRSVATWTITSDDVAALDRVRDQIADSTMSVEALQLRIKEDCFSLDVKFATLPDALEDHSRRLHALATSLDIAPGDEGIWLFREAIFQSERATVKITMSQARIAASLSEIRAIGGYAVVQQFGVMMASLDADAATLSDLRKRFEGMGGSLSLLNWPASASPRPETWGVAISGLSLMREIKRQFDPNRILNPGRFVGGI